MEHVVKRLKRKEDIKNPYAVAWSMHDNKPQKHVGGMHVGITKIQPNKDTFQRNLRSLDYIANGHHTCRPVVIDRLYDDALMDLKQSYRDEEKEGINLFAVWKHVLDETKKDAEQAVVDRNNGDIRRMRPATNHRLDDPNHVERFLDPGSSSSLVGSPRNPGTASFAGAGHGPTVPAGSATTGSLSTGGATISGNQSAPPSGGPIGGGAPGQLSPSLRKLPPGLSSTKPGGPGPMIKTPIGYSSQGAPKAGLPELDEGKDQTEYDQEEVQEEVVGEGKGLDKAPESQPEKKQNHFFDALAGLDRMIAQS
jgi:hypothetical protein